MKHLLQHFTRLSLHPKNAKELKGLILQLAVQGKLTANWREENPDVEPASVLLERIQAEKDQLVNDKKIRKEKPLPEITEDEVLVDIPETWSYCRLGNIGDWGAGATPSRSRSEFYGGDINWFKSGELNNGIMDYGSKEKINELAIKNSSLRLNKVGDVLIAMYGATIGKTGLLHVEGTTNQAVCACTPFSVISNTYLHLLLKALKTVFLNQGEGGAQPNISRVKIRNQVFPLPPLEEQKAIVKTVHQLFTEVEQLETLTKERIQLKEDFVTSALHQLSTGDTATEWAFLQQHFHTFFTEKSNIKKLRESILQLAVQGKLTHQWRQDNPEVEDASVLLERIKEEKAQLIAAKKIKKEKPLREIREEEIPYELPEGWVWCRLTELANVGTGSTPAKSNLAYYENGTFPWYTSSATNDTFAKVQDVMITQKALDETNCKIFPSGSLIIALYGQGKTRGQISELVTAGATNQAIAAMVFYKPSIVVKQYLKYFFQKIYHEIRLLAEGGAQPNLNVGKVKNTLIPLPPIPEIEAIVEKLNTFMSLCEQLEQTIQTSKATQEDWMKSSLREVFETQPATIPV